ncbi:MAG: TolC family protein [Acidobacteria bacterium]|nr:TolC family protein [Acidobacteriota bacterium]MBV9145003.1 TolC family protein [Acidobacteriota bacterium]MBV9437493.1 TolC family protein [Acidobacteriota bacterium]
MRRTAPQLLVFALLIAIAHGQQGAVPVPTTVLSPIPRNLSLFEAERLLVERNLTLAAARFQVHANEAARRIAAYKPNPQLQLGMEQVPFRSPVPNSAPRFFATNSDAGANPVYTAQFGKLFERGGKREFRTRQADALVSVAAAQMDDALRNQLFALRQAFGNAILARDNLILAAEIDAQYAKTENLTAERVRAGDLPGIELYRMQAGHLQFHQAVIDAQSGYEQATRDVLNVLSAGPQDVVPDNSRPLAGVSAGEALKSAPLAVVGDFSDAAIPQTLEQLKDLARANRPDLKVAQANLRAAEYGLRLAQAQRSRDINVATEYQRVGDDDSVGIVTQIPLFLYNNGKAGIELAQAQRAAAEAQLHQLEVQIDTDVEKAYQAYLAARRSVALYSDENLKQVRKVRDITEFSYQHGAVTLLELLDAERTVRQAASSYNQARSAYQLSVWQLEQAAGRDLP